MPKIGLFILIYIFYNNFLIYKIFGIKGVLKKKEIN